MQTDTDASNASSHPTIRECTLNSTEEKAAVGCSLDWGAYTQLPLGLLCAMDLDFFSN